MKICIIDGCNNMCHARGFCNKHYKKYMRYADPLFVANNHRNYKHGKSHTTEYRSWYRMVNRCLNPYDKSYIYYGARGITVCERWKHSFSNFLEDMGLKPFPKAQIDRIDNNGNYEFSNCRWTSNKINTRNSRGAKLTMEKANKIRKEYIPKITTQLMLARKYYVDRTTISDVLRNKSWS